MSRVVVRFGVSSDGRLYSAAGVREQDGAPIRFISVVVEARGTVREPGEFEDVDCGELDLPPRPPAPPVYVSVSRGGIA